MSTPGPWVRPPAQSTPGAQASSQTGPAARPVQSPPPAQAAQAAQPAQPAQASQPAQPARGTRSTPAAQSAQGSAPKTPQGSSRSRWGTPRLLRLARAGAATAVLLTGVTATGTFSTDGLNATPDVLAGQWVAAERAGVEMAHADLLAAQRLLDEDPEATREAYDAAVTQVGTDLATLGVGRAEAENLSREWSSFVLGVERATAEAAGSSSTDTAATVYNTASSMAKEAVETTDTVADRHADDLSSGSRSVLTGTVGTAATLLLVGLLVWLALRTRRIINIPLLIATAITAGLTYMSINPTAVPFTYDRQLTTTSSTAAALQEVYQARQAQHAAALGFDHLWSDAATEAERAVDALQTPAFSSGWDEVVSVYSAGSSDEGAQAAADRVSASQEPFEELESNLRQRLDRLMDTSHVDVGAAAFATSSVVLVLGVVGAVLAWAGLSRRLKEYR